MATILTDVGLLATSVLGMVGDTAAVIVAEPVLLIPVGLGLLGAGIGIFKAFF